MVNDREIWMERYGLAMDRIRGMEDERLGREELDAYFASCREYLMMVEESRLFLEKGGLKTASLDRKSVV